MINRNAIYNEKPKADMSESRPMAPIAIKPSLVSLVIVSMSLLKVWINKKFDHNIELAFSCRSRVVPVCDRLRVTDEES